MKTEIKQVIIIRKDLKMRRGKEIAQGSHASMSFLSNKIRSSWFFKRFGFAITFFSKEEKEWIQDIFTKIVVTVNSEEELLSIYNQAKQYKHLNVRKIIDNGLTEFNNVPTTTCICIGPNYSEDIDLITKNLKLY